MLIRVPQRWGDMDAQGHVNNAGFVDYLQEARADFLLSDANRHLLGGGVLVVAHQIEYLAPVEFSPAPIEIDVVVAELGASRFVLAYELRHDSQPCARARTTLCPYDFETQAVRRLTTGERGTFAAELADVSPLRELRRVPPGPNAFRHPLRVRWSDLDSYGHVNNVKFFDYVQEGRIAMTVAADATMARASGGQEPENLFMVVRQDVEYRAQLDFRLEPYEVRTAVADIGRTSVTFTAEIGDPASEVVYASAATVLVCADPAGRPVALPDRWREALVNYQ